MEQLERFASEFLAQTGDGESSSRSRDILIYSGSPVYRYNFWTDEEYMLTLSLDPQHVDMSRLDGAPLLQDHIRTVESTVGVIEHPMLSSGGITATARFADSPDGEAVWNLVKDGILRSVSVEAQVRKLDDITPKGQKMRQMLAVDWQPQAVAVVPVGADPKAQFLSAFGGDAIERLSALRTKLASGSPAVESRAIKALRRLRLARGL